ncbi:MAG TPA: hypothetical protein DEQ38_14045 [Elusimicrobia bacterium]|nr:MAG: hypothetical protein A2089_09200 [Elusimicrobia bacterium GWD2_63_28]HBB66603.1 hypothetical protein [Elusimicrobiota bacterium]HCC49220.1 hypothetical protein [Elusimicrobiota bacterium]
MGEDKPYILLVEDDPDIAQLAAGRLADLGCEIKCVSDTRAARAAIKERVPALILLDYKLPGENGLEFVESFKARGETCPPFIVMTGHSGEEVAVAMLRAGARDYLVKGVSFFDPLKSAVQRVLEELESARRLDAARLALKESEERSRMLFEQARDSILLLELQPEGAPVIRDANAAALLAHGYTREELLGKPVTFLDAEAPASLIAERTARLKTGNSAVFEVRHRRKDGSVFDLEASVREISVGGKHMVISVERDITERKKADKDIHESYEMERMLNVIRQHSLTPLPLEKKLADQLSDLFSIPWLAVEPKGAIFLVNGKSLTMAAQQGLPPALLAACARLPFGKCLCGRAAESGKVVASAGVGPEHEIGYEGMPRHGHYCAPIIAAGATLGVLNLYTKEGVTFTPKQKNFIQAVTDIIAADILRARVEEQLAQSQKMEAVGQLAGGVAHDFNNILTAIRAYAGFIYKALLPGNPMRSDAEQILAASDRAAALTRQLLAFSRKQILTPQVVDLNRVVGDMTNMLKRLLREDIELVTKLTSMPCAVLVDPGQLEQVIMNLVVNARDAMPKGGTLNLETDLADGPEMVAASLDLPRGPVVRLRVRDTGSGMTDEVKNHIFEPFYTTKEKGKGTGLGLSTVFGIIKQSNGQVSVESEPGKGTTFSVYLPLLKEAVADIVISKPKAIAGKSTETVLLVEDDEMLRRLGERLLKEGGYTVITASSGKNALEVMERYGKPVDLLLSDVVMPGISGRDLARQLESRKLIRRTLYMSGYTDEAMVKHGALDPGIALIYKPFSAEALAAKLREVLDGPADKAQA